MGSQAHGSTARSAQKVRFPQPSACKPNPRPVVQSRRHQAQRHRTVLAHSAAEKNVPLPAAVRSIVTDDAVPEAHKGLHGFLYGEGGGAEAHEATQQYTYLEGEDDGKTMLTIWEYLARRGNEKPVGVYAVYDNAKVLQYIGYSRNIVLSLKTHRAKLGGELCAHVRAKTFLDRAIHSRANLEREVQQWLDEQEALPPGNGPQAELWSSSAAPAVEAMSEEERLLHAEQKLKLQKAMGTKLQEEEVQQGSEEWRQQMRAAVEGEDWSAVISEQTSQTIAPAAAPLAAAPEAAAEPAPAAATASTSSGTSGEAAAPVSPFTTEAAQRDVQAQGAPVATVLTVESVSAALDDVRPYLVADGGDVEVVGVEGGVVLLQLQGACSSCPSQSSTMKMGIESALKRRFGDLIRDIIQVNPLAPGATVELVDRHLNMLRGAVAGLGGSVEVVKVEGGVCELKYNGPPAIGKGLMGAIRDQFHDIREVRLV